MIKYRLLYWMFFTILIISCSKESDKITVSKKDISLELVYEHEFQYSGKSCPGFISTQSSQFVFIVNDWFHSEIVKLNSDYTVEKVLETKKTLSGVIQSNNNNFLVSTERGDYDILDVTSDFSLTQKMELGIEQYYHPKIIKTVDGFIAMFGDGMAGIGKKGVVYVNKYDFNYNKLWENEFESLNGDVCFYDYQNDELLLVTYTHELLKIDNQNSKIKEKIKLILPAADIVQKLVSADNNLYFLTLSNQTIDIIPDDYIDIEGCCCDDDIMVYKAENDGTILWKQSFGASNANEVATDLIVNSANEIFVSGKWGEDNCTNQQGLDGNYSDIYLIKLSNSGEVIGEKRVEIANENEEALHLVESNDNIYVMCRIQETVNNELKNWLRMYKVE